VGEAPLLWLLQGKYGGDNAQVLALGDSLIAELGAQATVRKIAPDLHQRAKTSPNRLPEHTVFAGSGMTPPWPDVVIACGQTPCVVAQWLKRLSGDHAIHVQIGRLGAKPEAIDLILETAQYGMPPMPNLMPLTLPIVRRESPMQQMAAAGWEAKLGDLPRPWLGVLVGGPSSPIRFGAEEASQLLRRMIELRRSFGGSQLIAYGPRTPNAVREVLELGLKGHDGHRVFGWPPPEPNPYPALLEIADRFLVTSDSASMIADACVTGKPVELFRLPIPNAVQRYSPRAFGFSIDDRRRRRQRAGLPPDALDRLRDALVKRRWLTPFRDMRDFLLALDRARIVGALDADTESNGRRVQAEEIAAVTQRIGALLRAKRGTS